MRPTWLEIAAISTENGAVMPRPPITAALARRLLPLMALVVSCLMVGAALAQGAGNGGLLDAAPSAGMISPNGADVFGPGGVLGSPGQSLIMPNGSPATPMVPAGQVAAIEAHRDVVARETLATSFVVREADDVVVELEVAGA